MKVADQLSYLRPYLYDDLIRVGSYCDGGYLIPKGHLGAIDAMLSFGISVDWNLEANIRKLHPTIPLHCYDHTVGPKLFLKHAVNGTLELIRGRENLVGLVSRLNLWGQYKRFFRGATVHFPERIFNRKENTNDATIDVVFSRIDGFRHVLLKMDIEGGEYHVIPDIVRYAELIDILIIEFHDTDPLRAVFAEQISVLLTHFRIAHVHGNNYGGRAEDGLPDALEITFVSQRLGTPAARRSELPLPGLDSPCNPKVPDLSMMF